MSKSNASEEVYEQSGTRYVDYYLDLVRDNQYLHKNEPKAGILEDELANIIQAAALAKTTQLWSRVREFGAKLADFLDDQSRWTIWAEITEWAIEAANHLGDSQAMAESKGNMGTVLVRLGRWDEAKKYYEQALGIFRNIEDIHNEALTLSDLGTISFDKGDWTHALDLYEQSLTLFNFSFR